MLSEPEHAQSEATGPREVMRTRRMRLREFEYADAQSLLDLDAHERVTRHLLDHEINTPTRALLLIDQLRGLYNGRTGLGIWHASDDAGRFLGYFSLMPVVEPAARLGVHARDSCDVEIGVRLHPDFWGQFYALEGGRALCRYAFNTLGLHHLVAFCDPDNRVIPLLLRRLGFRARGATHHIGRPALGFKLDASHWHTQRKARRHS